MIRKHFVLVAFAFVLLVCASSAAPPKPKFICPENDGLYPKPDAVTEYWECGYGGKAFLRVCGQKNGIQLIWNEPKHWCDYPENVHDYNGNAADSNNEDL